MEEPPIIETPSRWKRCRGFLTSCKFKLYCSYFLSSWGDRMWAFALSIALGKIGENLEYPAASSLVNSIAVLLFGSVIGMWVDRTPRLKATRISLFANNLSVALSAATLVVLLLYPEIRNVWTGGLQGVLIVVSILLCAVSVLASVGTKICVTKDWVVVICGADKEELAEVNSMMVRIDMASLVLSPLAAGQIMVSFSIAWGCAFIAFWNVISFPIEFYLLWAVYKSCPALAVKKPKDQQMKLHLEQQGDGTPETEQTEEQALRDALTIQTQSPTAPEQQISGGRISRYYNALKAAILSLINGYKTYFRQSVLPAGLALMSLYLTVLSFDGITTVYVMSLGIAENILALCRGIGAIMGFVGSYIYPRLRRNVGVHRTGLISLTLQWTCLLLPLASIWLPGSNFDPKAVFYGNPINNSLVNCSDIQLANRTMEKDVIGIMTDTPSCINGTVVSSSYISKCSVVAFITGIAVSRAGLWMTDLSISQIFQETVDEHERGVVNGVQSSLNNIMNIVKSILVICLPDPRTFGILVIISWLSVFAGYCSFCYYTHSIRGHLMPFHKQLQACTTKSGNVDITVVHRDVGDPIDEELASTPGEGGKIRHRHH